MILGKIIDKLGLWHSVRTLGTDKYSFYKGEFFRSNDYVVVLKIFNYEIEKSYHKDYREALRECGGANAKLLRIRNKYG